MRDEVKAPTDKGDNDEEPYPQTFHGIGRPSIQNFLFNMKQKLNFNT